MKDKSIEEKRNFYLGVACAIFLVFIGGFFFFKPGIPSLFSSYSSKNIYVYNLTDGKKVKGIRDKERVAPASLTKIMTTSLALEKIDDLSKRAPIDVESYREMVAENSSMAGFYGHEATTYRDLLYGTILASGGECAKTLAIRTMGSEEDFVKAMNQKAEDLGLKNTHFVNPEGLDREGQYSSAEDIGRLLAHALEDGDFYAIFTKKSFTSTKTLDHPKGNTMVSTVLSKLGGYQENGFQIIGGKSGTTKGAGYCWATLAEKEGKEYIVVVMGAPFEEGEEGHIKDTLKIMEDL